MPTCVGPIFSQAIKIGILGGGGATFPIKLDESLRVIRETFINRGYECRSQFTLAVEYPGVGYLLHQSIWWQESTPKQRLLLVTCWLHTCTEWRAIDCSNAWGEPAARDRGTGSSRFKASVQWSGRTGSKLQMNQLSLRNNRLKFKIAGKLLITLEEFIEHTRI